MVEQGRTGAGATRGVTELQEFYQLDDATLWVTMADGHLWWAFSKGPVIPIKVPTPEGPTRYRETRDGWHREDLNGEPLTLGSLSSALTRTANYRMTICKIERVDYLLRRIRGDEAPLHAEAAGYKQHMIEIAARMIADLHWEEFETLVDLIFARGGWRRTSLLGKDMPDVDLVLDQPVTGETAWVQVKSKARQAQVDDYLERFESAGSCDRFFFVCHSPVGQIKAPDNGMLQVWMGERLAEMVVDVGLFGWVMERIR